MKNPLVIFILLQVMDLGTTLAAFALGGQENNPVVAHVMAVGPVGGLLISKLAVIGIAILGAALHKQRGLRVANFAYTGVIAWNATVIARLAMLA
jgi:hypothetical protein